VSQILDVFSNSIQDSASGSQDSRSATKPEICKLLKPSARSGFQAQQFCKSLPNHLSERGRRRASELLEQIQRLEQLACPEHLRETSPSLNRSNKLNG
jgi:hypothetical protein